jgi:hypothetical protein
LDLSARLQVVLPWFKVKPFVEIRVGEKRKPPDIFPGGFAK